MGDQLAGKTTEEQARVASSRDITHSESVVSSDKVLLALAPLNSPLVIGQRGLTDLLGDLAVATDDLSS
jgi:hypothetical protein